MAVNFAKPVTSDLRADVLAYIRDYMAGQAKLFDGETLTSTPTGAIRYSASNSQFEKWNGSTWAALALGFLPTGGGTLTGSLTGTAANFTSSLQVNGSAVWHAGNLTPSNYLPLGGGTMSGTLNSLDVLPTANNARNLGSDALRYAGVYATNFYEGGTALSSKYAAAGHSHSFLPLTGGTLTGTLTGTSGAFSTSLSVGGVAVSLAGHTHDDRYYTESEVNSLLSGYSTTSHSHAWSTITSKPNVVTSSNGTNPNFTRGTGTPSGGNDGDMYCQYT